MNLPTGARGRWAALGLLTILLTLLYRFALAPLWESYRGLAPGIAQQRTKIEHYQQLLSRIPQLQARFDRLQDDTRFTDQLVSGTSSALAAAAMQQRLQNLVQEQTGRVLSTRVGKPQPDGDFEQIIVHAQLQISLAGLQTLLYSLETQPPYLFVRNLNIHQQSARGGQRDDQLQAQLDIYGLRLPELAAHE